MWAFFLGPLPSMSLRTGALAVYTDILKTRHVYCYDTIYLWLNFNNFLFLLPLLVLRCSLFSCSTWCSQMETEICNINVKHSQLARDLVSLMMVIIWSLVWLLCRMCSGIFPKIRSFELVICIKFWRGKKSPTPWIFKYCSLDRNVCNLLVASKLLYIDHMQITTLCDKDIHCYIILYKKILLLNSNTRLWREWLQHWMS